jgi:hypothetical protein
MKKSQNMLGFAKWFWLNIFALFIEAGKRRSKA